DVETGRRLAFVQREDLEELFAGARIIARLELFSSGLERVGDDAVAFGHLLPRLLDACHGIGVVDIDQENPRPDLDRLLLVSAAGGVVSLLEKRRDFLLAGPRLVLLGGNRRRRRSDRARGRLRGRRRGDLPELHARGPRLPEIGGRTGRRGRRGGAAS